MTPHGLQRYGRGLPLLHVCRTPGCLGFVSDNPYTYRCSRCAVFLLSKLHHQPLVGGLLIEYERGYGCRKEYGRGRILNVGECPEQRGLYKVWTDSDDANMAINLDYYGDCFIVARREDGVCFWEGPQGWCYAAFPLSVKTPVVNGFFY